MRSFFVPKHSSKTTQLTRKRKYTMNSVSTAGNYEALTFARFAAPAFLPTEGSMRLSLISVWLSTLEQPFNVEAP